MTRVYGNSFDISTICAGQTTDNLSPHAQRLHPTSRHSITVVRSSMRHRTSAGQRQRPRSLLDRFNKVDLVGCMTKVKTVPPTPQPKQSIP